LSREEPSEQELVRRPNDRVLQPFWAKERLRNEAVTIQFIASNTTIPVPQCRLYTKDGLLHLELKRITNGVLLEDMEDISRELRPAAAVAVDKQINTLILPQLRSPRRNYIGSVDPSLLELKRITNRVLLEDISGELRSAAAAAVEKQINTLILPQLRSLRRNYIGGVDPSLPVFPPQRVYDRDRWPWERISSANDCYVLYHNDLGPQNIFVGLDTFQIVGIIDWGFAGFPCPL